MSIQTVKTKLKTPTEKNLITNNQLKPLIKSNPSCF